MIAVLNVHLEGGTIRIRSINSLEKIRKKQIRVYRYRYQYYAATTKKKKRKESAMNVDEEVKMSQATNREHD